MARHRHLVNVRADGIAAVLGPLLSDARITAAALVDVDSGMVLDAWSAAGPRVEGAAVPPDLEMLGAQHAEVVRCALALLTGLPGSAGPEADTCEVVLGADGGPQHLLRTVPDPHGDRLALSVVVDGPRRVLDRVRKRLRSISVDALTAGPSMTRRPVLGGWSFATPRPDVPARPVSAGPSLPGSSSPGSSSPGSSSAGPTPPDLTSTDPTLERASSRTPARSPAVAPSVASLPPPSPPAGAMPAPVPALSRLDAHWPDEQRLNEQRFEGQRLEKQRLDGPVPVPAQSVPPPEPTVPRLRAVRPAAPLAGGQGVSRPPSPPAALPAPPRPRQG